MLAWKQNRDGSDAEETGGGGGATADDEDDDDDGIGDDAEVIKHIFVEK